MDEKKFAALALDLGRSELNGIANVQLPLCDDGKLFRIVLTKIGSNYPVIKWNLAGIYAELNERLLDPNDDQKWKDAMKDSLSGTFFETVRQLMQKTENNESKIFPILQTKEQAEADIFGVGVHDCPNLLTWSYCTLAIDETRYLTRAEGQIYSRTRDLLGESSDNAYQLLWKWGNHLWIRPFQAKPSILEISVPESELLSTSILAAPELLEDLQLPGQPVVFPFHLNRVYVVSSLDENSLEFLVSLGQALQGEKNFVCSVPVTFRNNSGVYVWNFFDSSTGEVPQSNAACSLNTRSPDIAEEMEILFLRQTDTCRGLLSEICWTCRKTSSTNESMQRCSKCHIAHYCSKECQGTDWKRHKKHCSRLQHWNCKEKKD